MTAATASSPLAGARQAPVVQRAEVSGQQPVCGRPSVQPRLVAPEFPGVRLAGVHGHRRLVELADRQVEVQVRQGWRRIGLRRSGRVGEDEAKTVWADVQAASVALGDDRLGNNGTLDVIVMENNHPAGFGGLHDHVSKSVVLYPSATARTVAHETAHVYFKKHLGVSCRGSCNVSEIKKWGVNEGFAKITAHRVTGDGGAKPASADNVSDILNGTKCTTRDWQCAHDLGNLVFDAYEALVAEMGGSSAFDVYLKALLRLKGSAVTPAALHKRVSDILEERAPHRIPIPLPDIPDPFMLPAWKGWLTIYWAWC